MAGFRDTRMAQWLITKGADPKFPMYLAQQKSIFTQEHMMQVLAEDSKLVMLDNGQLVDYLQLEVRDASRYLANIPIVQDHLQRIHDEVDCLNILHIHDIQQGKTYLMSNYKEFLRYLSVSSFEGTQYPEYRLCNGLLMRKDSIPFLKNILNKVDTSAILAQFLQ